MNFKRRRRKRGGHKGCCGMCSLATTDGRRNGRVMTPQEILSVYDMMDAVRNLDLVCRPRVPVTHGYYIGPPNLKWIARRAARRAEEKAVKLQARGGRDGASLQGEDVAGADPGLRSELSLGERKSDCPSP